MKVGIVGNGEDKFTDLGADRAFELINNLALFADVVISGHSPLNGVDIWAEQAADEQRIPTDIKEPLQHRWDAPYGYKARNLDIARESDIVHVVVANVYPNEYRGRRFELCYHCVRWLGEAAPEHVKSGGCWTGYEAIKAGNKAEWHIISNY
jgi:hypothetical protein